MMNQNAVLREQLRRIAANLNKKHVVLRKQVVKTCDVFDNQNLPVFPYQVCFSLFRQLPETNSLSASLLFLPLIQNIINLGFATPEMSRQIIALLTHIKSLPKFHGLDPEAKIQQILLLLVSKSAISLPNLPATHAILNILMALDNSRHKLLWTKSLAITVQISLLHLNEVAEEPSPQRRELFLGYLGDVIRLARGEPVKWMVEPVEQFVFMGLLSELLEEKYFRDERKQFREQLVAMLPALRKLILKLYEGALYQIPNSPSKHWELSVEAKLILCLRVACKVAALYECGFQLLEEVIKIVSEKSGPKGLGYECINYLFASPQWMHAMLQSPSGDLFNFLMTTLFNTVKLIQPELRDGGDTTQRHDHDRYPKLFAGSSLDLHFSELSQSGEGRVLVKSIDEVTFTFFSIYSEIYSISLQRRLQGKPPLEKTYKFIHKTVFEIAKAIIGKQMSEQTLQSLLKICERIINLAGVFGDCPTAGVFIKLLCRHCLPAGQRPIGHRHVQINKMILNTANCLGNLFSTACWVTLWKAFENYALYYNRYLLGQEHLQTERESDVQILYASMESIFTQSPAYEDQYLQTVLQSLVEVTYECLENSYVEETKKIFAFERIQQVFKLNLHRIARTWPPLISSLLILTTSRVQQFRLASLALVDALVPIALHHLHTHPAALQPPLLPETYEAVLLEPWGQLANSPFAEVRVELGLAVVKLVIDYGHIMGAGWGALLGVVRKLGDLTALQAIVETYLDKIENYMEFVVEAIDDVERALSEPNQKYLCLTLIWAVGDHAYRKHFKTLLRKIYSLLLKPESTFSLGTDARHSSFYILAELLVHNCDEKEEDFWGWVFDLIDTFVAFVVGRCLEMRTQAGVEEVLKNMLTNLLKIYRKCIMLLEKGEGFLRERVGKFFELTTRLLQFRHSEIYQSTLRQVREMLAAGSGLALQTSCFWSFLEKLTEIYYIQNDNKILKVLITYLPVDIYEVLTHSLQRVDDRLPLIYKLLEKVFLLRLQAEEKDIKIAQMRIFFEEKIFNQFYRKLHAAVVDSQCPTLVASYLQMLTKTLHKLLLYEDEPFLARMLPFLGSLTDKHPSRLDYEGPLELVSALLALRTSEPWRVKHLKSKDPPIWLVATHESVRLGHSLAAHLEHPSCQLGYAKLLALEMDQVGRTPKISAEEAGASEFLMNFYDSECTLLYFVVDNYLLHPSGTLLLTNEHQNKLLSVLKDAALHFKEGERCSRAKNAYDVLFKSVKTRPQASAAVLKRQAALARLLLHRIGTVLKGYSALLNEGRGGGSDLEGEARFLLRLMVQLETGADIFVEEREWIKEEVGVAPQAGSKVWASKYAMLFLLTPLLLGLVRSDNSEVRQLVSEALVLTHRALLEDMQL